MCGRYSASKLAKLPDRFKSRRGLIDFGPRFNITPMQEAAVVTDGREGALMRWGLIPAWAQDEAIAAKLINARAETLREKPSFKNARRCLVPADGFYERRGRAPYRFTLKQGELFAFAGLWDQWRDKRTFTIVTTAANALVARLHERMPLILRPEDEERWLAGEDVAPAPYPAEAMRAYEVKEPGCIEPAAPELPF